MYTLKKINKPGRVIYAFWAGYDLLPNGIDLVTNYYQVC